jgi:hypothetical protein
MDKTVQEIKYFPALGRGAHRLHDLPSINPVAAIAQGRPNAATVSSILRFFSGCAPPSSIASLACRISFILIFFSGCAARNDG